jgi:thiosulfate dehydrogenase [quinone] large subunit
MAVDEPAHTVVDAWRARLASPGALLLPQRLFLGVTFTFAGLQKLADPRYLDPSAATSVQRQFAASAANSPVGGLLEPLRSSSRAIGVLIALAEIAVGVGTLLGLRARLAAAGGALLSLTFLLTVSWHTRPYYYGSDVAFLVMWLPLIAAGPAGVLTLDAWLTDRRRHDPGRRSLLRGGVVTGAVAAAALGLGGLTAWIGRAAGGNRTSRLPRTAAADGTGGGTTGGTGGTVLARPGEISPGSAKRFTDSSNGSPAWLVHLPAGGYRAFTAVCTHAGCTVDFQTADQQFSCPCHGGVFSAASGAVEAGPPPRPLETVAVRVNGDTVLLPP